MSVKIKICGITSLGDAQAALDAGADFLGLIFAQGSPRRVDQSAANEIVAAANGRAKIVGVFKDQDFNYVSELSQRLGLDYVQCHGAETEDYVARLPLKVIRALELKCEDNSAGTAQELINRWKDKASILLFDRPKSISDPAWYRRAVSELQDADTANIPYLFAGGLTGENVGEVISHLKPFGVDVASSIESSPGKKDIGKMNDFCSAVKKVSCRRS